MRAQLCVCILLLAVLVGCGQDTSTVTVTAVPDPPEGWMADGWGEVSYTFNNRSRDAGTIVGMTYQWEAAGKLVGEAWSDAEQIVLPARTKTEVRKVGHLPTEVIDQAVPGNPICMGTATVQFGDETVDLPFRVEIPKATLPEPLKRIEGKHVGLELMESRFDNFTSQERLLRWLDQSYEAMHELTGVVPYDGERILFKEAPRHPWYAYAGNPVILNTARLASLAEEVNAGIMPFGLVHEMGHDFDVLGKWYIWNGESCEWQANWKLNYAYETIPDQDFKAKWSRNDKSPYQPRAEKRELVSGPQLMQSYFLFFGDGYLGDHDRTWDTMLSDDLHAFFLRFVREYGWEPFKAWYRTYAQFQALGYEPPETPEEKLTLIAAILQHHIGVELAPMFERWRMPVTAEKIEQMNKRYPIANPDGAMPESPEAAAALITLTVANEQPDGWMREGWGRLVFTLKNEGELPSKVTYWKARWMVNGKPFAREDGDDSGGWRDTSTRYLGPGEEITFMKTSWHNPKIIDAAAPNAPLAEGTVTLKTGGLEFEMPWQIEVPEAVMKEKLVRVEGKHMAYEITETHHTTLGTEGNERLIRWLDQSYEAMVELTGYAPYDGEIITIIESPDHPYYAYAGNPIIMDTTHMDKFVEAVNNKIMVFGWVHELGHDFDHASNLYGRWYMWSYGASEAQANLKVVYIHEAIPDQDWKAHWSKRPSAAYPAPVDDMPLDGKDCMDRQFIFNLDGYLGDPTIPWTRRFCQHVFMQRIACVYGWDPIKKWYRTYKILADQGCERPETPEEKIKLMAAILCETTGVDLVPLFQLWRAPITYEDIAALKAKYPIKEAVASIVLPGEETVTAAAD